MAADFRVFLSAVTSEFGIARDALANDLQARDLQVRVQRSFRQEPGADTLLRLLHDYIRDCAAVVCVIGTRSGACPSPAAAAAFAHLLPPGITEASYTQWEFFFARAYKRRLSLYVAAAHYQPDRDEPSGDDFPELQKAFIRHIKAEGLHYVPFSNRDQLRAEVLKEPWPEKLRTKPIVLPYASLGSLFKGREAFLRRLRESLTRDKGGATAIVSKAFYGLGGIGKTRAAVEYAWAYREDYTALLFVQGASPEELLRNLAGLAGPLQLPESEAPEEEVRLNAVLAWLAANPGWLLILDNIDMTDALTEVDRLMGRLAGGHVVLTSRFDRFARQVEPLELDVLSEEAAVAFLLEATEARRQRAADDNASARELADELGGLALVLEQAAATIGKLRCGFRRYLEIWRSSREKVVGWARSEITGYHHAVAATWQTSVDQLTEAGRRLLERLAFLAPDPVPMFLLGVAIAQPAIAKRWALWLLGRRSHPATEDLLEALIDVAGVSLVTRDVESDHFSVHRLVQDVTRRSLDAAASHRRITEALGWVTLAFVGDPQDVHSWPRLDPLAPHALSVTQWAHTVGIAEPRALLMNQLGQLLYRKSRHTQAERLFRLALAIDAARLGPDHPDVGRDLNNLARLFARYQPAGRGRTPVSPGTGDRRGELRAGPSGGGDRARQPRPIAGRHQSTGRGGAADAPGIGDVRDDLRAGPSGGGDRARQPRRVAGNHEPTGRGGAADAPGVGHPYRFRAQKRAATPQSRYGVRQLRRSAGEDGQERGGDRGGNRQPDGRERCLWSGPQ
jgi:hypothetical protein